MNCLERCFANNITVRLLGIVFVLAGSSVAAVLTIGRLQVPPLQGAIAIIAKLGSLASVIFVECGLLMLVSGKHSGKFMATRHGQRLTSLQRMTTTIMGLIAVAVTLVLPKIVEGFGDVIK